MCLELWSSAEDSIRISAFMAIQALAKSTDDSIMDMVLKVYCGDRLGYSILTTFLPTREHILRSSDHPRSLMHTMCHPLTS
jgi:hypothetical protein